MSRKIINLLIAITVAMATFFVANTIGVIKADAASYRFIQYAAKDGCSKYHKDSNLYLNNRGSSKTSHVHLHRVVEGSGKVSCKTKGGTITLGGKTVKEGDVNQLYCADPQTLIPQSQGSANSAAYKYYRTSLTNTAQSYFTPANVNRVRAILLHSYPHIGTGTVRKEFWTWCSKTSSCKSKIKSQSTVNKIVTAKTIMAAVQWSLWDLTNRRYGGKPYVTSVKASGNTKLAVDWLHQYYIKMKGVTTNGGAPKFSIAAPKFTMIQSGAIRRATFKISSGSKYKYSNVTCSAINTKTKKAVKVTKCYVNKNYEIVAEADNQPLKFTVSVKASKKEKSYEGPYLVHTKPKNKGQLLVGFVKEKLLTAVAKKDGSVAEAVGSLKIIKKNNETNGSVPGVNVTFTITGPNNYKKVVKTTSNGTVQVDGLPYGIYTITETVPKGYRSTSSKKTVTITDKHTVKVPMETSFTNIPEDGKLKIVKIEEQTGKVVTMKGFKFKIWEIDGEKETLLKDGDKDYWETDENGMISVTVIMNKKYKIKEIAVNGEFLLSDEAFTIPVRTKGSTTKEDCDAINKDSDAKWSYATKGGADGGYCYQEIEGAGTFFADVAQYIKCEQGSIIKNPAGEGYVCAKTDPAIDLGAPTTETDPETGQPITSCPSGTLIGGKCLSCSSGGVPNASGQCITSEEAWLTSKDVQTVQVDSGGFINFTNSNQLADITIYKKGVNCDSLEDTKNCKDKVPLEGAMFDLVAAEDCKSPAGVTLIEKGTIYTTLTTDKNGAGTFAEVPLCKYNLIETKGVEGYKITDKIFNIEPKFDGSKTKIRVIQDVDNYKINEVIEKDVPKTALDKNMVLIIIALIMIASGAGLAFYYKKNIKK